MTASRSYPALDLTWPLRPDHDHDDQVDLWLADLDDESPVAVEERPSGLRVFFATAPSRDKAAAHIIAIHPELACDLVDVPDDDWAARSQASLTAVRVGHLVIAPPWAERDDHPTITIQPSMGFGTGHHASTRLCLHLLQDLPLAGAAVLDVGTGSGVLALACARLGAARVLAIDHDDDALQSARENVQLNNAGDVITLTHMDVTEATSATSSGGGLRGGFDLVLANLTGGLLIRLSAVLADRVRPGGRLILSGVMTDEADAVAGAFEQAGLRIHRRLNEDEWVGLDARK